MLTNGHGDGANRECESGQGHARNNGHGSSVGDSELSEGSKGHLDVNAISYKSNS